MSHSCPSSSAFNGCLGIRSEFTKGTACPAALVSPEDQRLAIPHRRRIRLGNQSESCTMLSKFPIPDERTSNALSSRQQRAALRRHHPTRGIADRRARLHRTDVVG